MRKRRVLLTLLSFVFVAAAGLASAQGLAKLPADVTLPRAADSPGPVVFSHQLHMAVQARADCTVCHPRLAPIVKTKSSTREAITHARMEKGLSCGSCHNGRTASGFEDCSKCHKVS